MNKKLVPLGLLFIGVLIGCGGEGDGIKSTTSTGSTGFPTAASELTVDWYPGLEVGRGFNLDSATQSQEPNNMGALESRHAGGDEEKTSVFESDASSFSENGSNLDLAVDGRYLAFHGSSGYHSATYEAIRSSEYSFSFAYDLDKKRFAKRMPDATYEALKRDYNADPVAFEKRYGSHYVAGADFHSYVRATYWISKVDSAAASATGLTVNADGKFVFGSVSSSTNISNLVKTLASRMSVNVTIETNVTGTPLSKTITNPSDVDGVLAEVASIQAQAVGASPVPYRFYVTPWKDIFAPVGVLVPDPLEEAYRKITADYYRADDLRAALENVATDQVRYAYLGNEVQSYYQSRLIAVQAEVNRLRNLLQNLRTDPSLGDSYQKADLNTQFLVPGTLTYTNSNIYANPNFHYLHIECTLKGASNVSSARIAKGGQTYLAGPIQIVSTGPLPSDNEVAITVSLDLAPKQPLWDLAANRNDSTGWSLEVLDAQDKVVVVRPLP